MKKIILLSYLLVAVYSLQLNTLNADPKSQCDEGLKHIWTKQIVKLTKDEDVASIEVYKHKDNYLLNVETNKEKDYLDTRWIRTIAYLIAKNGNVLWRNNFNGYTHGDEAASHRKIIIHNGMIYRLFHIAAHKDPKKSGYYLFSIGKNGKIAKKYFSNTKFMNRPKLARIQHIVDEQGNSKIFYIDCTSKYCAIEKLKQPIIGFDNNRWEIVYEYFSKNYDVNYHKVKMIDENTLLLAEVRKINGRRYFKEYLIKFDNKKMLWKRQIKQEYGRYVIRPYKNNQYYMFELPKEFRKGTTWSNYSYDFAYIHILNEDGKFLKKEKITLPPDFRSIHRTLGHNLNDGIAVFESSRGGVRRNLIITGTAKIFYNVDRNNWHAAGLDGDYVFKSDYSGILSKCALN